MMSKYDYIALIKEKHARLGRVPGRRDFKSSEVREMMSQYGSYANAVLAAGLRPIRIKKVSSEELIKSLQDYYEKYGVSPTIETQKCSDLYSQTVYKRVLACKSWSDVLKKAGLPVYFADKDAPLDDDLFIQYSIEFVKQNNIKNMNQLLHDRRFRSQDYVESHFGSVRVFAELIGMDMLEVDVPEQNVLDDIWRVYELLGRTPSIPEMEKYGKYEVYHYYKRGLKYNEALLKMGLNPRQQNEACTLSDEEMLNMYIDISEQNGLEKGATSKEINRFSPFKYDVFVHRFGSISALRLKAGYDPGKIRTSYTVEGILLMLEEETRKAGRILVQEDIHNSSSLPSLSTVRRYINGTWDEVRKRIWIKVSGE